MMYCYFLGRATKVPYCRTWHRSALTYPVATELRAGLCFLNTSHYFMMHLPHSHKNEGTKNKGIRKQTDDLNDYEDKTIPHFCNHDCTG